MWAFYQDTGSRKWGHPYLTREFFDLVGERLGERLLLFLAYRGSQPIAGALNFIGRDALYGVIGPRRRSALPPFRAVLLPGDRMGDREWPRRRSRPARRASTRSGEAMSQCSPARPISFQTTAFAKPWRTLSKGTRGRGREIEWLRGTCPTALLRRNRSGACAHLRRPCHDTLQA